MSRVSLPTTRFTLAEFERLVEADAFGTERVELLNGRLHFMTQRRPHMAAVSKAAEAILNLKSPQEWLVIQGTLRLDRYNAPDPDLMWLAVPLDTPEEEWGKPLLVIEISDSTYRKDSGVKLRTYAHAGIQEYWIVNLRARRVEVCRDPQNPTGKRSDSRYGSIAYFEAGQSIALLGRPGTSIAVSDLVP